MRECGQPESQRRLADGASGGIGLAKFCLNFPVNLLRVIEVIGERRMYFRKGDVRVLAHDFIGRPSTAQVIHDDLGDTDPWRTQKPGRLADFQMDVWVLEEACHVRKRWQ